MSINSSRSAAPLGLIAGATASGKSALALALAERLPVTIVNADSAQVYRDLRVLSARPSDAETARTPHALFGHRDGALAYSAADWAAEARVAIDAAWNDGRVPILVGGTGLYLRTLLDGIAPVPPINAAIRADVRALPVAEAHAALLIEDPVAAERLAPADTTRVARALEVVRATGRTLADWQRERTGGISRSVTLVPAIMLPPRDWLVARCDTRFDAMLAPARDEVTALLARDLPDTLPVMRAIGVREVAGWLRGDLTRDEAAAAGRLATRRYAKRQYTWFSHQPPADWPRITELPDEALAEAIAERLRAAL